MKKIFKTLISVSLAFMLLMQSVAAFAADEALWDPFNGDKEVNIVYLGGSITEAADGWRDGIGSYIKSKYEPLVEGRTITNYNAGKGGTTSFYGLQRLERDVISKNPDLVFVEFSVNDTVIPTEQSKQSMEGIVRRLQSIDTHPIIVFVYTSTAIIGNNVQDVHHEIAEYYNIPEINFVQCWNDMGYKLGNMDASINDYYNDDKVHPNGKGHSVWTEYATKLISETPKKYFRHSELKVKPFSSTNYSWITPEYVTAKSAFDNGMLTATEGKYSFNDTDISLAPGAEAKYKFSGKTFTLSVFQSNKGINGTYDIDGGRSGNVVTAFSGNGMEMMSVSTVELTDGEHTFTVKADENADGELVIKGFFVNSQSYAREYPSSYPANFVVNTYKEEDSTGADVIAPVEVNSREYEFMKNVGLLNDVKGDVLESSAVTRSQFAQIIANIFKYSETSTDWAGKIFETDNNNVAVDPKAIVSADYFEDVSDDTDNASAIKFCKALGYMNGTDSAHFSPSDNIETIHALKVLVDIMGYKPLTEKFGGYPNGYAYVMTELKMLRGKSLNYYGDITYKQLAKVIYDMLDVRLMNKAVVSENDDGTHKVSYSVGDDTFIEKFLELKRASGIMEENLYTGLTEAVDNKKSVVVSGKSYVIGESMSYVNEYIGRNVDVYYSEDKPNDAKYIALNDKDSIFVIDDSMEPYYDTSTNRIVYKDENDDEDYITLKRGAYVIYNGEAVSSYSDANNFKLQNGTITAISFKGGKDNFDVVVVDNYESWYLSGFDKSKLYATRNTNGKNLDEKKDVIDFKSDTIIFLTDANGETVNPSDLEGKTVIDVAQAHSKRYFKVIAGNKTVDEFSIGYQDNEYIGDGTKEYELLENYKDVLPEINLGSIYKLYLNSFGKVVWYDMSSSESLRAAVMEGPVRYDYTDNRLDKNIAAKFFNQEGKYVKVVFADTFKVKNADGETSTIKNETDLNNNEVSTYANDYQTVVRYRLNKDGKVSYIEVPIVDPTVKSVDGQMYDLNAVAKFHYVKNESKYGKVPVDFDKKMKSYLYRTKSFRGGSSYYFSNSYYNFFGKNENTKVFYKVPGEEDTKKMRYSSTITDMFQSDKEYYLKGYSSKYEDGMAECILVTGKKSNTVFPYPGNGIYLVEKITVANDDDGNPVKKIQAKTFSGSSEKEAVLTSPMSATKDKSGNPCSLFDYAADYAHGSIREGGSFSSYVPDTVYEAVGVGDLIICGFNYGEDQEVAKVNIIYDRSKKKLAGTNDTFISGDPFNNPYALNDSGDDKSSFAESFNDEGWTRNVGLATLVAAEDGTIRVSFQDAQSGSFEPNVVNLETKILSQAWESHIINYKNDKPQLITYDVDNLRPAQSYGTKGASKVFYVLSKGSSPVILIYINED